MDRQTARDLVHELAAPLDELYHERVISGYQSFVLVVEDGYEEYDLDQLMIERETGGVLPAIFLNLTYRIDTSAPDDSAAAPVLTKYGFRHMLTESDLP